MQRTISLHTYFGENKNGKIKCEVLIGQRKGIPYLNICMIVEKSISINNKFVYRIT